MSTTLLAIAAQWLHMYNCLAVRTVAQFLTISTNDTVHTTSVTLVTPSGAILRTIFITPKTAVAEIVSSTERLYVVGQYDALDRNSLVWDFVTETSQLAVIERCFEGRLQTTCTTNGDIILSLDWHPSGNWLAGGFHDNMIRIWDTSRSIWIYTICIEDHSDSIYSVRWNQDGTRLASGSVDGTIRIWDASNISADRSLKCVHVLHNPSQIYTIDWHPRGTCLASGSTDGKVRIWDLTVSIPTHHVLRGHTSLVAFVRWNSSGTQLASASHDLTIRIWDLNTWECKSILTHPSALHSMCWNPSGTQIVSGSWDTIIRIWDLTSTVPTCQLLKGHKHTIAAMCWDPFGPYLVSGSYDRTIRVWNMHTHTCTHMIPCNSWVRTLSWHPNKVLFASGTENGTIQAWK